ncbi:MAG: peptidylprolyl isomerase [Chitinophagaceae bacterium]
MARTTPGSASSEYFICIGDQPAYDYGGAANADEQGYAAFGKVIKGMDVVKKYTINLILKNRLRSLWRFLILKDCNYYSN